MQQLIRYGLVGVASNAAIYFVYLLITYLGVEPKTAMTLMFIIGASIGFVGNRQWTFAHRGDSTKSAHRFLVVYAVAYLLNYLCMWIAVDRMGMRHYLVQAVNIVVISVLLFIAQKYWIFAFSSSDESSLEVKRRGEGNEIHD